MRESSGRAPSVRPRSPRRLLGGALAAGAVVLTAAGASAAPPQVTIYMGGYGAAPPQATPAPPSVGSGYIGGGMTPGEAALAQVAAYQQYLLYLSVVASQPRGATPPNPSQYFNNGAAVTTVPSAGQPGSAYFSNGAAATSVPSAGQPGGAYFANGAEATRLAPLAPSTSATPPPPPPAPQASALPPWWWSEPATPPPKAAPPPAPAVSPPLAVAPSEPPTQEPAMSFEEWLRTMGAPEPQVQTPEPPPPVAEPEEETAPLAEPSATANDVRQRATAPMRQKTRERLVGSGASKGWVGLIAGAFAIGLLLGALAMRRARLAIGHPGNATSGR